MIKKTIDNKKLIEAIMELGINTGTTKPGTILASKTAKRTSKESFESKLNKKINKLIR